VRSTGLVVSHRAGRLPLLAEDREVADQPAEVHVDVEGVHFRLRGELLQDRQDAVGRLQLQQGRGPVQGVAHEQVAIATEVAEELLVLLLHRVLDVVDDRAELRRGLHVQTRRDEVARELVAAPLLPFGDDLLELRDLERGMVRRRRRPDDDARVEPLEPDRLRVAPVVLVGDLEGLDDVAPATILVAVGGRHVGRMGLEEGHHQPDGIARFSFGLPVAEVLLAEQRGLARDHDGPVGQHDVAGVHLKHPVRHGLLTDAEVPDPEAEGTRQRKLGDEPLAVPLEGLHVLGPQQAPVLPVDFRR